MKNRASVLLLLCLIFAVPARGSCADGKAGKKKKWVVHQFSSWEISTPEGFGFQVGQIGEEYRDWFRNWDKLLYSRPGAECWLSFSEKITAVIGNRSSTGCGGVALPLPRQAAAGGRQGTRVTPVIEGSDFGIPTRRFTVHSEAADRGEKCMEHSYSVEGLLAAEPLDRIEVVYTYTATYRRDMVPSGSVPDTSKGGPNYQTYLQMLATLKPIRRKAAAAGTEPAVTKPAKGYGVVPIIR